MSDKTKSLKRKYYACKICAVLLLFLPLGIFIVLAFIRGSVTQKMTLGVGVTLALVFCIANALFKIAPRSTVWILIIALAVAVQKVQNAIYVTGACVILEECLVSKLESYYGNRYKINKEIDDRLGGSNE